MGAIGALNAVLKLYPDEPWYGFIADDEVLLADSPKDWDLRLIERAGRWDIAHGWEDWHSGTRCQGYVVLGGDLVRAVGFLGVPSCFHNFGFDCAWEWLAANPAFGGGGCCRIHLVPEVRVSHKHHKLGKSDNDACYQLADSKFDGDRELFWSWVKHELPVIAKRVKMLRSDGKVLGS